MIISRTVHILSWYLARCYRLSYAVSLRREQREVQNIKTDNQERGSVRDGKSESYVIKVKHTNAKLRMRIILFCRFPRRAIPYRKS